MEQERTYTEPELRNEVAKLVKSDLTGNRREEKFVDNRKKSVGASSPNAF